MLRIMATISPPVDLHSSPSTVRRPFPVRKGYIVGVLKDELRYEHTEKEVIVDLRKDGKAMVIAAKEDSGDDEGDNTGR